jgi:hypothetical protein
LGLPMLRMPTTGTPVVWSSNVRADFTKNFW